MGVYCLEIRGSGAKELLGCWTRISEIKQGTETNRLKVVAVGNRIELYVNDELVGHVRDNELTNGRLGLAAGSFSQGNVHIVFDNVRVTEP